MSGYVCLKWFDLIRLSTYAGIRGVSRYKSLIYCVGDLMEMGLKQQKRII